VKADRTDKDLEQVRREQRRHAVSLDHSITMSAAGRMVDEESSGWDRNRRHDQGGG
jgi:hypothetical protein